MSGTTLTAYLGLIGIINLASDPVTVYPSLYGDLYGRPATTTPEGYALEGCNAAVCSVSDLTGCMKKAFCWAFVPATWNAPPWSTLGDQVGQKPPFGYVSALTDALSGLNASGTPAFSTMTTQTRTDLAGVFDPLRDGLMWIIWLSGAVWLYNRVKNFIV